MNKVEFTYNDDKYFVQCKSEEKMKDIISKFMNKINKDRNNIVFLYNGQMINEELAFKQCANRLDRSRNYINVVVIEGQNANDDSLNFKKSNYIICPKCGEKASLSIKDFKLSISGCNHKHNTEELELKELEKTQLIDQSKIHCNNCNSLKSDSNENKFFFCLQCKQNLCPGCKNIHVESHKDYIKDYEEIQFYCQIHFDEYSFYCNDCEKDCCPKCKKEHENHNLIEYDSITPDFNLMKNQELRDAKEKIYQLKTIINGMIYQLNNFNKNLDTYFDIYDTVSNFDINKRNYYLLENVNNMKKYNNNFMGNVTEITNDDNLKVQFTNIVGLQSKIDFKKLKKKFVIEQTEDKKENSNDVIDNQNIIIEGNNNYEIFNINKMKELQSYTAKKIVDKILALNDGRILTIQSYRDEAGHSFYKLCVYSITDGFICDLNIDFEKEIEAIYQMKDGNLIVFFRNIKIIKINKSNIEDVWNFNDKSIYMKKLSKDKFFIKIYADPEHTNFFNEDSAKYRYELYKYDKSQLILYKDIDHLYEKEHAVTVCQINDNEYVFYTIEKNSSLGTNQFLIFYDIENDKIIKKLKVGDGDNGFDMLPISKDNLIISGDSSIILVDIKNRTIRNNYNFNISVEDIIYLNEKVFLYYNRGFLYQYEFENINTIKLKEKKEIESTLISKYPKNKLIVCYNKNITIYG